MAIRKLNFVERLKYLKQVNTELSTLNQETF